MFFKFFSDLIGQLRATNKLKCKTLHSFPDFPKERVPVVLAPLLYPETKDISTDK